MVVKEIVTCFAHAFRVRAMGKFSISTVYDKANLVIICATS